MSSAFDKKLKQLLNSEVDQQVSNLPDGEKEEESEALPDDMVPVEYEKKDSSLQLNNEDLQSDYEYARSNLYGLMGKSNAALELTLKIAIMSEHPRALEVAANLIKTSSDLSKELISLHKAIEKKNGQEQPNGSYTQVNNYYTDKDDKQKTEDILDDLPDEEDHKDTS